MKKLTYVGIILYSTGGKILLEDRRKINKHGENWSFFGGTVENGESHEDALTREIKEELGYNLAQYEFFDTFLFTPSENPDLQLTYHMYLA